MTSPLHIVDYHYVKGFCFMDIYRPTFRMDPIFRSYIEDCFHASSLDRNQIARMLLMSAAHSANFKVMMRDHLKPGKDVPTPYWSLSDKGLYLSAFWERKTEGNREVKTMSNTTSGNKPLILNLGSVKK